MKITVKMDASEIRSAIFDWMRKNKKEMVEKMSMEVTFEGVANDTKAIIVITEQPPPSDWR